METHPEFQMKHWVALVLLPLGMLALQAWGYTPERKPFLQSVGPDPTSNATVNGQIVWLAYPYTGEQFDPHLG